MSKLPFIVGCSDLTKLMSKLRDVIPAGRENALSGNELARMFGESDDRRIRVAIRELIAHGAPIASAVTMPYGYYRCSNEFEAADYVNVLQSRIREDEARLRDFRVACSKACFVLPVQNTLFEVN